jgi:hypothetical protein
MARQGINTGISPNDGLGDSLLTGAIKINSNFSEIYSAFGNGNSLVSYANTAGIATISQGLTGTPNISVNQVGISSYLTVTGVSTFYNDVHFDYDRVLFIGSNDELQLFHNGVNSYIDNFSSNSLVIRDNGAGIQLRRYGGGPNAGLMANFNTGAGVELYYDSVLKFQTFQNGVAINDSVGIGTTAGNPPYRLTVSGVGATITQGLANAIADFTSSVNGYGQLNVRNSLSGTNASGDIIATANTGTDTSNFIDLGINNTGFTTTSWTINGALDGYLYTSDGNLSIGAAAANKYLSLFAGGTLASNEQVRVTTTGVGIGTTNPAAGIKLDVVGGEIKAGRVDTSNEGGQLSFGRATDNATAWYIDVYGNTSTPSLRFVDVSNSAVRATIDSSGNIIVSGIATVGLGATSTPPNNSQMSFELTSNTNLRIKVRGTDGVLRSANITLA